MRLSKWEKAVRLAPFAVALVMLIPAAAPAAIMTFEHVGVGAGSLAGVPFPASSFTITALGDTAARQSLGFGYWIDHTSASIAIAGLGSYSFVTGTRTFVSNTGNIVGFSRAGGGGLDLFNGPADPAFGSWDELTPIGPISGQGGLLQWTNIPVDTSGGVLVFDNAANVPITFTAFIPEPAAFSLLSVVGLVVRRRR